MTDVIRMSELYAPTVKEDPADADIVSHKLLLRAGMIRKTASGIYTFLPLGKKVLAKIENIIRQEMDAAGAQEIMMPALQPSELWLESGRWDDYGPELMRLSDRHGRGFCLGPTHEELITALVRNELRSYKELPVNLYQIQVKFRDEIRPRFGLLRSREFIMKDAYSFHADQESLQSTYDRMGEAYGNMCDRMGLEYRPVEADSGQIGGSVTTEFMALAEAGEAELVHCTCGYAANTEVGVAHAKPVLCDLAPSLEKRATPGVHAIAELAAFLKISEAETVKALSGKDEAGNVYVLFIPGDHELNEIKAARIVPGFQLLSDEEMLERGLCKGCMGPVGLPDGVRIVCDESLKTVARWVVGANEEGFHFLGACHGEDFTVDEWADLITATPGDGCPHCGAHLQGARGIEVSQIFQLSDKYSAALGAKFMAEDGSEQNFLMGCYGVGVTRSLAAAVEQHHDEAGIIWPFSIAPAHVCVMPLIVGDDKVAPVAEKIAAEIAAAGLEVVIDDRDERAGVKFNDADLIGWPLQIIVGRRGLENHVVEVKHRRSGFKKDVDLDSIVEILSYAKRGIALKSPHFDFDALFTQ